MAVFCPKIFVFIFRKKSNVTNVTKKRKTEISFFENTLYTCENCGKG